MPRLPVEVVANVKKARETAVLAVEIYNRPATDSRPRDAFPLSSVPASLNYFLPLRSLFFKLV